MVQLPQAANQLLWACAPGIIVGIIMALWNKQQKKRDDERRENEKERVKSETLRISLLLSTAQLSYAVAMAIKRGSPNGEIEAGIEQYDKAMKKFREFEREQIAKNSAGCDF